MWLKLYIIYFIVKNVLKVFIYYQLKKRDITIKHILVVIKNKRR